MKLFDSTTQDIIDFVPQNKQVTIYVCGITPYDSAHLGHIFTFMIYDFITRILQTEGYEVKLVRNITDVDEPIYAKALELNIPFQDLANDQVKLFEAVMNELGFLQPVHEPRASQYLNQIFIAINELLIKGFAYKHRDGDIYFDISKITNYGNNFGLPKDILPKLAKKRGGDPLLTGKRNPLDFLLFKTISDHKEIGWDAGLLGYGRPGWHIECSVMSCSLLGVPFDLHGGGNDLIFPHHESEIAQTYGLHHKQLAKHWLHVAPLLLYGEKMSKSLGNLIFAKDLLKQYPPAVIRLALMDYSFMEGGEWVNNKLDDALKLWNRLTKLYKSRNYDPTYVHNLKNRIYELMRNNLCTVDVLYELNLFVNQEPVRLKNSNNRELDQILSLLGLQELLPF